MISLDGCAKTDAGVVLSVSAYAGPRRLAGSWISPDRVPLRVAGCRASLVWWEASCRWRPTEPTYSFSRRDDYNGPRMPFTDAANKVLSTFMARQVQRLGGFDAVWSSIFPAMLEPEGERSLAADLRRRAEVLERRAELTEMAADGLIEFRSIPASMQDRGAGRLPMFKVFRSGGDSREMPTERAMLAGEQVGWLVGNTVVPLGETL